jgi:hypothetical protein
VEGDVGKLTPERGAIHRKTDAVEPFVHPNGILAHALADDIERDPVIANPRELVAREVKALPVKRPASSRTRTATAPMSAAATCASALVGGSAAA